MVRIHQRAPILPNSILLESAKQSVPEVAQTRRIWVIKELVPDGLWERVEPLPRN